MTIISKIIRSKNIGSYCISLPVAGNKGGARSSRVAPGITKHETADQCTCHVCDTKLGGITREQPRIIEDVVNGRWEVIQYMVTRRWCPHCKKLITTPVPNALHKQRFGNRALAMMSFLKMIGVSFGKIQMIFLAFYNIHLSRDAILNAVRTVSNNLQNEYELIQKEILKGKSVHGDETTWRVMGMLWWVWCVVGKDAVWFNIQEGRGKDEAKKNAAKLQGYSGVRLMGGVESCGCRAPKVSPTLYPGFGQNQKRERQQRVSNIRKTTAAHTGRITHV